MLAAGQTHSRTARISAMSGELIILVLLIVTALAFDFTNGFHDTGNAMATSIATGALKPRTAVLTAGVLNLVGAFLSIQVAKTISSGPGRSCRRRWSRWRTARTTRIRRWASSR